MFDPITLAAEEWNDSSLVVSTELVMAFTQYIRRPGACLNTCLSDAGSRCFGYNAKSMTHGISPVQGLRLSRPCVTVDSASNQKFT